MTPSEIDAMATTLREAATRQRQEKGLVREAMAAAQQALADERDSRIYDAGFRAGSEAYAPAVAQAVAQSVVDELAAKGMLRSPAAVTVKTVERGKHGRVKAIIETAE